MRGALQFLELRSLRGVLSVRDRARLSHANQELHMNKDTIQGAAKEVAGKVQKEFGKAVDSPKHTLEGGAKELEGKTQKTVGQVKEKVEKQVEQSKKTW
jgi:uncharacterized protein YjbJ (UPF0337 family)